MNTQENKIREELINSLCYVNSMIGYCQSLKVGAVITDSYMKRMDDYYIPNMQKTCLLITKLFDDSQAAHTSIAKKLESAELVDAPKRVWGDELKEGDIIRLRDGEPLRTTRGLQGTYLKKIETNESFRADIWDKIWDDSGKHSEHHEFDIIGIYDGLEAVQIERDWFRNRLSQITELKPNAVDVNQDLTELMHQWDNEIVPEYAKPDSMVDIGNMYYFAGKFRAALATHSDVNKELAERIAYLEKQLVVDSTDDCPFTYMSYADLKAENAKIDENCYNLAKVNAELLEALETFKKARDIRNDENYVLFGI